MPILPPSQCAEMRCKAPSIKGSVYCEAHAPKNLAVSKRREQDTIYRSAAWQSIRQRQLSMHPLCQACHLEGRLTPAQVVDHVFRWKDYGRQAFTLNLFSSLCAPCHSRKGHLEQRNIFRRYTEQGITDYSPSDWPGAVWLALKAPAPTDSGE